MRKSARKNCACLLSCPSRGTWIEMSKHGYALYNSSRSCPSRGTWIEIQAWGYRTEQKVSRAPRGARGLKYGCRLTCGALTSRAPRGARGLKLRSISSIILTDASCPSRGTWIEIFKPGEASMNEVCRAPRGARGLKLLLVRLPPVSSVSCPSRGTWIEIVQYLVDHLNGRSRAPRGARGLKCNTAAVGKKINLVVPLAGHVD